MEDVRQTIEHLTEAEELGCDVLNLKHDILELNRRAAEYREAGSEIRLSNVNSMYAYEGMLLVKTAREELLQRITANYVRLQAVIKAKGEELRTKVFRLQDLEMQNPYSGRNLIPLNKDEMQALSQIWGVGHA